ncbi:MAG: MOSC domain-containing protein, partial [Bacteroidetes bacterium]|nr:MOSC domain-containing protein [Bacteroidota bacterium]
PFLIIGQQSLNDLNSRLDEKVPMNRFRPNFVFDGGEPFDEDKWRKFKIGNVIFESVKPCSRCLVTTVNQETAEVKEEPLKTLSRYRAKDNHVYFGQNLLHEMNGVLKVGDEIEILEFK